MDKRFIILFAALLYGMSIPVSKLLLKLGVMPGMLGAFSYLGAGLGLCIYNIFKKYALHKEILDPITRRELPYTIAMVILDIFAITLLMNGILRTNSANASLLSNFEITSTSLIALIIFKEHISKRIWIAISLILIAGIILTFDFNGAFEFSLGSILVVCAYICWGAENNCTKMISSKNTQEITIIKGLFCGIGSLIVSILMGEVFPGIKHILLIMLTGFFSYGLSVAMYIKSQKYLGAAKTAAYYSIVPFLGVVFSFLVLGEKPNINFYIALIIMIIAAIFITESVSKSKACVDS